MKKGFSVIKAIIIVFLLSAIGVGGYYGYNNYIAPSLNPNSAFIPESLQEYARGADAEFLVIIDDEEMEFFNLFKNIDAYKQLHIPLKAGLIIASNKEQCAFAALEFDSEDTANDMLSQINDSNPPVSIKHTQEGPILTISVEDSEDCLQGKLVDNPLFDDLDSDYLDNQLIIAINNEGMYEIANVLMSSMGPIGSGGIREATIPTANTQGLISPSDAPNAISGPTSTRGLINSSDTPSNIAGASGEGSIRALIARSVNQLVYGTEGTYIYAKLDDSKLSITGFLKLMDETKLENTDFFKNLNIETDDYYKLLKDSVIVANKQLKEFTKDNEDFTGTATYADYIVTAEFELNVEKLISDAIKTANDAEKRGRDMARLMNINVFLTSLETFNADNGYYPKKSACFNQAFEDDRDLYFSRGQTPKDPSGAQTIGTIECEDGYYYQYLGEDSYALWAKGEIPENNNTDLTPPKLQKAFMDEEIPELEDEGTYYLKTMI